MKSVRLFVLVLSLLFGLGSSAFAQFTIIGKLTPSNNSVTKVMESAGCNTRWIFQVLQDSDIKVTELRHLPTGQKVVLQANSCKDDPPAQVAHMSEIVLRMDAVTGQVQKTEKENITLRASASEAVARLESVKQENNQLKTQKKALETKLDKAVHVPPQVITTGGTGYGVREIGLASLGGLVVGLVIMGLAMRNRKPQNTVSFPRIWNIRENGEDNVFTLVGAIETTPGSGNFVGKYKCPHCFERNISGVDRNMRTHLSQQHSKKRIETIVDPSLVERPLTDLDQVFDLPFEEEHVGGKR
jgi:hypothetical protein